jgi:type I restriction enzyme S subunit
MRVNMGWLAGIPSTWRLLPAKASFSERREPNLPDDVHLTPSQIHGVLPQVEYMSRTGNAVVQNIQGQDNMKHVDPDDFIIHLRSFQGGIERSTCKGKVSTAYTVLKPSKIVVPDYFRWLLKSDGYVQELRTTTNQLRDGQSIKFRDFIKISLPVPPPEEQRTIAEYLDRETARVDTLIEEQQRLIDMLDERRDGVIAEAVTKGVRPGATLVESGVEWLGNIPEGWSVKPLRRCGTLMTGSTPPTDNLGNFAEEANDRPWVRPQDLSSETRASAWLTADGWSTMRPVPAGSVLVGCIAYSLGSVGYVSMAVTTNQQITSVVPAEEGRYLYYVVRAAKSELWAASQINRVPILNNQRLGSIRVPVPPVEEQRLIAAYLDEQTENIDRIKAEAQRFVELARERRSALITAAVTGQFDVGEAA